MIICSCNVITDHDVRSAVVIPSRFRTAEVYNCLGCRTRCGRCARTIKRIMADAIKGCSDAGDLIEPLTRLTGSVPGHDQAVELQDLGLQRP
jgi:bacterioferritin-associated ferredoxin